jgi:hypothetical protein
LSRLLDQLRLASSDSPQEFSITRPS